MDTLWMADGNCRDMSPSMFFPSDGVGVEIARRVCVGCPAKAPCLEYALANRIDHGVWGGASERERRRIARRRRLERLSGGSAHSGGSAPRVPPDVKPVEVKPVEVNI